jgi:ribosomal protein S18 acetylase RimI-like enzyme
MHASNLRKENLKKTSELVSFLNWDTEYFGFPIAQIISSRIDQNAMEEIWRYCQENKIHLLQYKCDCHDRPSVLLAEEHGFHFADIRLTFERSLTDIEAAHPANDEFTFRIGQPKDIEKLKEIATDLYVSSRYYFDLGFPRDKVRTLYQDWVRKAVLGLFDDLAYLVCKDDEPLGYTTCRFEKEGLTRISLVGIEGKYKGNGLGEKLMDYSLRQITTKGCDKVEVVTQGRNYVAQRLYQRSGFITNKTEIIYHRWFKRTT